jgi:succinate dehydrogenase hydrophobic anchor subunit
MLHGLVKYEGLQQQLSNLNDRLSDLINVVSETVHKQNKVQYIRTDNIKLTYEY